MDTFDVSKQPNPAPINKPTSGSYGDGVALDNLKRQLPSVSSGGPAPGGPAPTGATLPPVGTGPMSAGPPAAPKGLFAPTQRPTVDVADPIPGPVVPLQLPDPSGMTSVQKNLMRLDALAHDPTVSELTREWAQNLVTHLVGASKR